jgi:hypothetical protein
MRWALVLLIALHGLIHVMGFMGAWGLGDAWTQIGAPIVPVAGMSLYALGIAWLVACLGLLASAVLLALDRDVWAPVALASVALSQISIMFWWPTAWRGTLPNLVILAAIAWQVTEHARTYVAARSEGTHSTPIA